MAKKHKYKPSKNTNGGSTASITSLLPQGTVDVVTPTVAERIEAVHAIAEEGASLEDIDQLPTAEELRVADPDVSKLANEAEEALELLRLQKQRLALQESELANRATQLDARETALGSKVATLAEKERYNSEVAQSQDVLKTRLAEAAAALDEREARILEREMNASAGFLLQRRESEQLLADEVGKLQAELSKLSSEISNQRSEWDQRKTRERVNLDRENADRRTEFEAELTNRLAELNSDHQKQLDDLNSDRRIVSEARLGLKRQAALLKAEQDILAEDRAAFEDRVSRKAAGDVESLKHIISVRDQEVQSARADRDALAIALRKRDEANLHFGGKTPEQILEELRALSNERDQLKETLSGRLDSESLQRLQELEGEREDWTKENRRLIELNQSLKHQLTRTQIATTELESLRDHKSALESSRDLLHKAIEELRADVDERIRRSDGKSPFPWCSLADQNSDLLATPRCVDDVGALPGFVTDLQQRIAFDPDAPEKTLYYSKRDLRCFLGGLAMSQLHILQGISGTGKTSLPLAFARAIGAGSELIEVQAGWRDRQDLVGHFNAFEHKFYEQEFLKALYRALCPRYRDVPFIIVLDEMNLSHPEQYFADVLSTLEQDVRRMHISLLSAPASPSHAHLIDEGQAIPVAPNVWFIGTANHDETTKDFADKTYDRSHVMELPRNRESFVVRKSPPRDPISLAALNGAFKSACGLHQTKATEAYKFLDRHLARILDRRFRIGWGNRLERQMGYYVPVVIGAGGSIGEALDHIVASKLIRKLRDRHDNRPEDIQELDESLRNGLTEIDPKWKQETPDEQIVSLRMLRDERRRLGVDDRE